MNTVPSTPLEPRSLRFRREREKEWRELEPLVDRVLRGGPRSLSPEEIWRLPRLYRQAMASLAVARATALDHSLLAYLENLAARAWLAVYTSREPARRTFSTFLSTTFPAVVRSLAGPIVSAGLILLLGAALAWVLVARDPEWFYGLVPSGLAAGRDPWAGAEALRMGLYETGPGLAQFSAFLINHNVAVGMLAFGLGAVAGLPAALLLFYNGLILGAMLALYAGEGLLIPFLGWILPHGIPELLAVVLCGGAGMAMGRALLFPGRLTRRDSLCRVGRQASLVAAGAVLLFAVAGVFEGFFRQLVRDDLYRLLMAALNASWILFWLMRCLRVRGARHDF